MMKVLKVEDKYQIEKKQPIVFIQKKVIKKFDNNIIRWRINMLKKIL